MGEDLREIIDHLNSNNRNVDTSDPVVQIGKIMEMNILAMHW